VEDSAGLPPSIYQFHVPINSSYFLDLTNPNFFPFYWVLKLPHFLVSESFVVLGFCFFLRAERDGRARSYVGAGLCYVVAGACRPYDMLFAMPATALYLAVQCCEDRGFCSNIVLRAVPILTGVPFLAYNYWIFKIHPIFRWWSLPGGTAPAVWTTALSFGLTFLLLLFALWRLRGRRLGQARRFNDLQSSERNSVHSPPLPVPLRVSVCNQHSHSCGDGPSARPGRTAHEMAGRPTLGPWVHRGIASGEQRDFH